MPILFACQRIEVFPPGARRILGVGAFFEILYIPAAGPEVRPEAPDQEAPEAPEAWPRPWPRSSRFPPTGDYKYICEIAEPDGSFTYPQDGVSLPGPGERMFGGTHPGQCACCYYRTREILEWTESGPGHLALMTPGWYQEPDGSWKWWHGDAPHGRPGWSARSRLNEENLEAEGNLSWSVVGGDEENMDEDAPPADGEPAS